MADANTLSHPILIASIACFLGSHMVVLYLEKQAGVVAIDNLFFWNI